MYKGKRDPEVPILVRRTACNEYNGANGDKWVEIEIPHKTVDNPAWRSGTIMVKLEQVFYVDRYGYDIWNQVMVNDDAKIVNSTKDVNRQALYSERMTPKEIIGSLLLQELWRETPNGMTCDEMYAMFENTGLTMMDYILRVTDGIIEINGNPIMRTPHGYEAPSCLKKN